jgi:serine/threonine protein kinase
MELPEKRYDGLHKATVLSGEEFGSLKKYMKCDIFKHLKILQRIGSDSVYGTVWLAAYENSDLSVTFAVKVQRDIQKSEHESDISYFLEKWFDNFLLMYYNIRCDNIVLSRQSLRSSQKNQSPENNTYSGMFMFMEVAMSDLRQLIKYQNVTKSELISYILQICDSIEIMATNFIYHGDLHLGNVFLVKRDGSIKAVIGDFGESQYIVSPTSHLSDMSTFISQLSIELKISALSNVLSKNKLSILNKHIYKQSSVTEKEFESFLERNDDVTLQEEKIQSLVHRDMDVIKDLVQGIF